MGYLNIYRVPEYIYIYQSGIWIAIWYLNGFRVPEYLLGTRISVGYLNTYHIFARLFSSFHETQYKISERTAVEHFWVCVYRRQWLRDDFRWYYHNQCNSFNYEITLHSHLFCDWPPLHSLVATISVATVGTHPTPVMRCHNVSPEALAATEFNQIFSGRQPRQDVKFFWRFGK